jgi:hypothetical protein
MTIALYQLFKPVPVMLHAQKGPETDMTSKILIDPSVCLEQLHERKSVV